ncbi:hypothetical protein HDU79_002147, partial [Rhizoclosmatium sp. JEL0117]
MKTAFALILAALVAFAVADTCTSITGASISILYPAQNQTVNVGDNLHIVWNYNNQVPSFSNVTLKFSIATAANANNAIPLVSLTTTKPAVFPDGEAFAVVPSLPPGKSYSVEAQYQDQDADKKWMVCFSPTFNIKDSSTSGSIVSTVTTTKSSSIKVLWSSVG